MRTLRLRLRPLAKAKLTIRSLWDLNSDSSDAKAFYLSTRPSVNFYCWEIQKPNGTGAMGRLLAGAGAPVPQYFLPPD